MKLRRALEDWRSWEGRNAVEKFVKVHLSKGGCGVSQLPRNGTWYFDIENVSCCEDYAYRMQDSLAYFNANDK